MFKDDVYILSPLHYLKIENEGDFDLQIMLSSHYWITEILF